MFVEGDEIGEGGSALGLETPARKDQLMRGGWTGWRLFLSSNEFKLLE
jgi:hypothetical protein